jgi:hypothetical protein
MTPQVKSGTRLRSVTTTPPTAPPKKKNHASMSPIFQESPPSSDAWSSAQSTPILEASYQRPSPAISEKGSPTASLTTEGTISNVNRSPPKG